MIEQLARLGYASKAVVYAIVGSLAAAAAANRGGRVTDTSGALRVILGQPFGNTILIILALGLCGYAAWRILDAIFDPDRHGTGLGGLVTRIGNGIRAVIYGTLGFEAFRLAQGLRASSGREAQMWAARIMKLPLGEWLIGIAGLIVAVYGVSQIVIAARRNASKSIDVTRVPRSLRNPLVNIGRFGVAARAVIIVVLGVFLVRAALQHDPTEALGIRGSILQLAGVFEGRWVLAGIACGLIAYAVEQALHAWCRRIRAPI